MDAGIEEIEDPAVRRQVRKQAAGVMLKSVALGALLTLVFFIIPALD